MLKTRFQSFDETADPAAAAPRMAALRAELARQNLAGCIVPRADRHQNEYVPASEERLAWLTGFTGSAGTAIVLADKAVLLVDGRYTLQARQQADEALFAIENITDQRPEDWIEANLPAGGAFAYDPWLHTVSGAEKLAKACTAAGGKLVPEDPVDAIWQDRPSPPLGPVSLHDLRFSGEAAEAKLEHIRAEISKLKADALVVSDPHALAWTFNIRGADVPHTPLVLGFAIIPQEGRPAIYVQAQQHGARGARSTRRRPCA